MILRYASDIINHAMRLAQQQALNSFSFRDILYLLNQHWRYCYERISQIDSGFYSTTVELTQSLTKLPPYVMGSVNVYRSVDPVGANRQVYTHSGVKDMVSPMTYHISGFDLYCWDVDWNHGASWYKVWLNYIPQPKNLFFTAYNRDPTIIPEDERPAGYAYKTDKDGKPIYSQPLPRKDQNPMFWRYGMYEMMLWSDDDSHWDAAEKAWFELKRPLLKAFNFPPHDTYEDTPDPYYEEREEPDRFKGKRIYLKHMGNPHIFFDITENIYRGAFDEETFSHELYKIDTILFDYPYTFITYRHTATGAYRSVIIQDILGTSRRYSYNAFDFTGRETNVRFLKAKYNDDTGMGVIVEDYEDMYEYTTEDGEIEVLPRIKELGFTPDTVVTFPAECVFDYLVAQLAKRFANKNESTIMDIDHAIGLAEREMSLFLKKDRNPFVRINNVVGPRISDLL